MPHQEKAQGMKRTRENLLDARSATKMVARRKKEEVPASVTSGNERQKEKPLGCRECHKNGYKNEEAPASVITGMKRKGKTSCLQGMPPNQRTAAFQEGRRPSWEAEAPSEGRNSCSVTRLGRQSPDTRSVP